MCFYRSPHEVEHGESPLDPDMSLTGHCVHPLCDVRKIPHLGSGCHRQAVWLWVSWSATLKEC